MVGRNRHSLRRISLAGCRHLLKEIVVRPQDPDTVYVGDRAWVSAGAYKTIDGGRNWTRVTSPNGAKGNMDYGWIAQWGPAVECMAISRAKADRVVFGKPESGLPVGQTKHLVLDPTSPAGRRVLYVTSKGNGVFRSEDGGDSWRLIGDRLPAAASKDPRGLLLAPNDPRHLRLALGGSPSKGSGLYETLDGGTSWRRTSREGILADIQDFQADPKDFATLYVCQREYFDRSARSPVLLPGGLFKSSDGGATWKRIYEFQFTILGYPREIDPKSPAAATAAAVFCELAERLGPGRVIWRYDPIVFTGDLQAPDPG